MLASSVWRRRWRDGLLSLLDFLWVVAIYFASQVVIWGLSCLLALAGLEFFASILGMLLLFSSMAAASWLFRACDGVYREQVKPKVDFINAHLGVGFPIPIVMMSHGDVLDGHGIARVIGAFVLTNMVSWVAVFFCVLSILVGIRRFMTWPIWDVGDSALPQRRVAPLLAKARHLCSGIQGVSSNAMPRPYGSETPSCLSRQSSQATESTPAASRKSPAWTMLTENWPSILSLCCALTIGLPVALVARNDLFLDAFVLWFIWITSVRLQRMFAASSLFASTTRVKSALVTLLNPVLATTLLMMAYTRGKAAATRSRSLDQVLAALSSGTSLHDMWTSGVTGLPIRGNPSGWFGAGDIALSLLECGILTWGFKLYECRHQLFSVAGVLTTMTCVAAAAGNVFLSVLASRGIGLDGPEALAFAARSTTLALAKPAMEAVGGNLVVNAILVVSNGILGQLIYPFVLDRLGVERVPVSKTGRGANSCETLELENPGRSPRDKVDEASRPERRTRGDDDAVTVAAGVAIGINGAAMGVSYLYETGSRAAPYAALSMTVFGVMTVVFTTVDPFKGIIMGLAGS